MGTEISLRHASQTFVENTIQHTAQTTILMSMDHCHLPIMVSANKQKPAIL